MIRSAGLDVMTPEPLPTDHELLRLPNATLLPHMATGCAELRVRMGNMAVENIVEGLKGNTMPGEIEF